jgi:hypothetical protein
VSILKSFQIFLIFLILLFISSALASAEITCCVGHGGEYACDSSNGTLYCKDGSVSTDCSCHLSASPTPTPTPTPVPISAVPSCVPRSAFDKQLGICKCDSGYTVYDNACIANAEYCWKKFGGNSIYNAEKNSCVCSTGYVWNKEATSCISFNELCQKELGDKSYYNSENNTCNCFQQYSIQNNKCQMMPTQAPLSPQQTQKSLPIPSRHISPILKKVVNSPTPIPTKSINTKNSNTIIVKGNSNRNYVTVNKKNENKFIMILNKLRSFISNIF